MSHLLIQADARRIPLADGSVHCTVTSPPYFGLRDYKVRGQIGLEKTPSEYVAELVRAFREVWRVMRDDSVLWLNIGDSYAGSGKGPKGNLNKGQTFRHLEAISPRRKLLGLKPKDLIGIPWMLAFALRNDGWYLRSEVIWHKRNGMTESVVDRPTKAHEQVFLLTKKPRYFYDGFAIQERSSANPASKARRGRDDNGAVGTIGLRGSAFGQSGKGKNNESNGERRNRRSVWSLSSENYPGSHFAVMPSKLAVPMVKAGTSERGACPICGAPWRRIVESQRVATRPGLVSKIYATAPVHPDSPLRIHNGDVCGNRDPGRHVTTKQTVGWRPTCSCPAAEPVPCRVLDPFVGSGTTLVVAAALGRVGIGCDLSVDYLAQARRRIERPHQPMTKQREQAMPLFANVEDMS